MAEYTKEQLEELYNQLPEDLQKAVFSQKIGEKIQKTCYENKIIDQKDFLKILKNVGYVFLGLLSPEEFKDVLEKKLKVKNAKRVWQTINNEVFMELKQSLEALYQNKIEFQKIEILNPVKAESEKPKPQETDKYRELIE